MKIDGKPVVDAKRPLLLSISPLDVKRGKTKKPEACAAALALRREAHCKTARVHLGRTYVETPKAWVRYQTPRSVRTEIISFDRGASFAPGDYTFSPLAPTQLLGQRRGSKKSDNNKSHKTRPRHHVAGVREIAHRGTR